MKEACQWDALWFQSKSYITPKFSPLAGWRQRSSASSAFSEGICVGSQPWLCRSSAATHSPKNRFKGKFTSSVCSNAAHQSPSSSYKNDTNWWFYVNKLVYLDGGWVLLWELLTFINAALFLFNFSHEDLYKNGNTVSYNNKEYVLSLSYCNDLNSLPTFCLFNSSASALLSSGLFSCAFSCAASISLTHPSRQL